MAHAEAGLGVQARARAASEAARRMWYAGRAMGSALQRTAWGFGALAWVLLAVHDVSGRAILGREPVSAERVSRMHTPGVLVPVGPERHKMHVVRSGRRGPHLVLVHGLGGSTADFEEHVMPRLANRFRVLALDLWGFGYSARDAMLGCDVSAWSAQLDALYQAYGIRKATLVGESSGATVVAHFAAQNSRRVERLVLLAPSDSGRWHPLVAHPNALRTPLLGEALAAQLDHFTLDHRFSAQHHERARRAARIVGTRAALLRCMRRPTSPPDLESLYRKIATPTLVMQGEDAGPLQRAAAERTVRTLKQAVGRTIPRASDVLSRDQPELVAEAIEQFAPKAKKSRRARPRPKAKKAQR